MDPLRKEEIETIQNRRTETVLRAVLRYPDKDVKTAVSLARKYLRDEEEENLSEEALARLAADDIDLPSGLQASNRDARFGRERHDRGVVESGFGGLVTDNFVAGQREVQVNAGLGENSQTAKKRRLPQAKPAAQESPEGEQPSSRREARRLLTRKAEEQEQEVLSSPVDDDAYSFLDADNPGEPEPVRSLLVPEEDSFWDEDNNDEEEEQEIVLPTRPTERIEQKEYLFDEVTAEEDFDLWALPEDDKPVPRKSNSLDSIMDQFGDIDI